MAIANAIGSNVFNILLGLGGPWFVSTLASGTPTPVRSTTETSDKYYLNNCARTILLACLTCGKHCAWSYLKISL